MKTFARVNVRCGSYSEIALNNYFIAKKSIEEIKAENDIAYCIENDHNVSHATIITCVFSIMAIESFFNDYAAKNLGDEEFYDNFDKLSLLSKFQLISKFILKTSIDKSKSYYGNLKATEKIRNELVHNKSKDLFKWMQDKNMELCDDINEPELDETATFKNMIDKLDEMLQEAKTAIKSMRDIAFFFEEHRSEEHTSELQSQR